MGFFWYAAKADWGIGVLVAQDPANVDVLFDGGDLRKPAKKVQMQLDVSDGDVPAHHAVRSQGNWTAIPRDAEHAEAQRQLPKRIDGFMQAFLSPCPDGLRSLAFGDLSCVYRWKPVEFARETLAADALGSSARPRSLASSTSFFTSGSRPTVGSSKR